LPVFLAEKKKGAILIRKGQQALASVRDFRPFDPNSSIEKYELLNASNRKTSFFYNREP